MQPQPKLTDIFKDPRHHSQIAQLPDSTFVGLIGHSLYAMSHLAYPMVVFSDALSHNPYVSRDSATHPGAPSGELEYQGRCRNLECYVGTHPSEFAASSRVSRLIEGGKTPRRIDGPSHNTIHVPTPSSNISMTTTSAVVTIPASLDFTWVGALAFVLACIIGYIVLFGWPTFQEVASKPLVVTPEVLLSSSVSNGVVPPGHVADPSSVDPASFEASTAEAHMNASKDVSAESGDHLDGEVRRTRRRPRGKHKGRSKKDDGKEEPEEPDINVSPPKGETPPLEQQVLGVVNDPPDKSFTSRTVTSTLTVSDSVLGRQLQGSRTMSLLILPENSRIRFSWDGRVSRFFPRPRGSGEAIA